MEPYKYFSFITKAVMMRLSVYDAKPRWKQRKTCPDTKVTEQHLKWLKHNK